MEPVIYTSYGIGGKRERRRKGGRREGERGREGKGGERERERERRRKGGREGERGREGKREREREQTSTLQAGESTTSWLNPPLPYIPVTL